MMKHLFLLQLLVCAVMNCTVYGMEECTAKEEYEQTIAYWIQQIQWSSDPKQQSCFLNKAISHIIENNEDRDNGCEHVMRDFLSRLSTQSFPAMLNYQDEYGNTLLHEVCFRYGHEVQAATVLLQHGADSNLKNTHGQTPLHIALSYDYDDASIFCHNGFLINSFSEQRPDMNSVDEEGNGFLHVIMHRWKNPWNDEFFGNIKSLLKKGVNPSTKNKYGQTPLHLFIQHLKKAALSDGRNYENPMHSYRLVAQYPAKMIQALQLYGANVQARDNDGDTPLHYAAHNRFYEVVPMLLFHGAQPGAMNNKGHKAIDLVGCGEKQLDTFFNYTTDVSVANLFEEDFKNSWLGKQCMQDCRDIFAAAEQKRIENH